MREDFSHRLGNPASLLLVLTAIERDERAWVQTAFGKLEAVRLLVDQNRLDGAPVLSALGSQHPHWPGAPNRHRIPLAHLAHLARMLGRAEHVRKKEHVQVCMSLVKGMRT